MTRGLAVMLLVLLTSLGASDVHGQTCPGVPKNFVGPPQFCDSGNIAYWTRCGATGLVCTPPASGTGSCICKQPPRCGDMVDGDCASAAACSGTNTGYLAPCGFGEQCNPFGPAS